MAIDLIAIGEITVGKGKKTSKIAPGKPFSVETEEEAESLVSGRYACYPKAEADVQPDQVPEENTTDGL